MVRLHARLRAPPDRCLTRSSSASGSGVNRGLAIGIAYLDASESTGISSSQKYVALPLIQNSGWRTAMIVIGCLMFLLIPLLLCMIIRDHPRQHGLFSDGGPVSSSRHAHSAAYRDLLQSARL